MLYIMCMTVYYYLFVCAFGFNVYRYLLSSLSMSYEIFFQKFKSVLNANLKTPHFHFSFFLSFFFKFFYYMVVSSTNERRCIQRTVPIEGRRRASLPRTTPPPFCPFAVLLPFCPFCPFCPFFLPAPPGIACNA